MEDFLLGMELDDLLSLASTITARKITPNHKEDAVECILLHSESPESILRRKKITRDYLFCYLHKKKVKTIASDDKNTLIKYTLEYWNSAENNYSSNERRNEEDTYCEGGVSCNVNKDLVTRNSEEKHYSSDLLDGNTVNTLAFKFCEWFYNLLNNEPEIEVVNFWQDAVFSISIHSNGQLVEQESAEGALSVVDLLNKLKTSHGLYFRPNICSDGVRGKSEPHGAAFIVACGTLHKNVSEIVGVFEQAFLIIRDPLSNDSWKVKKSELNLKSSNSEGLSLPSIQESKYASLLEN